MRGYNGILIFKELDKYDVKNSVIPNWLEKYMAFFFLMSSSLDKRFNKEKLAARKRFYSSIKDVKIGDGGKISDGHTSVKDYLTCEKTWDKFEMKDMGDYHDHYLKNGVLLSAEVFEKFIATCLKFHGHGPCHYFSFPGLSWDAMLKMTGIKLEKISDIDKYLFIEKG